MSSGELRERVEFQARTKTDDGLGNVEGGFAAAFECAAAIVPLRGGEDVMAARLSGRQPVMIRIRWSPQAAQITPEWRVRDVRTEILYNIRTAPPDPQRRYIDLLCESGVAT